MTHPASYGPQPDSSHQNGLVSLGSRGHSKRAACAREIAARVADGRYAPGQWLPTMAMVAAELGVSPGTVQQALQDLAARGIVARADKMGYYPGNGAPPRHDPPRQRSGRARRPDPSPGASSGELAGRLAERYITPEEMAGMLRVSKATVHRLIAEGHIDGVLNVGGRAFRIPVSAAEAYLASCVVTSSASGSGQLMDGDK